MHLTEKAGICSTDILALRFASSLQAKYYAAYLLSPEFYQAVVKTISGQQLPRTSSGKLCSISVPRLDEAELGRIVAAIETEQGAIAAAEAIVAAAPARKQAILLHYL